MGKMEDLRAGIDEMRSVARRLNQWALDLEQAVPDALQVVSSSETSELPGGESRRLSLRNGDLEALFRDQEADAKEVPASGKSPAEKEKGAAVPAGNQPATAPEKGKALTLPEVRTILAAKCAAEIRNTGEGPDFVIDPGAALYMTGIPSTRCPVNH